MSVELQAVVASRVGFASHQNAVPIVRELGIINPFETSVDGLVLALEADPPFLTPKRWVIDRLAAASTLHVTDRDVQLSATYLAELTESVRGSISLRLMRGEEVLTTLTEPVELLARNEWGGTSSMADLLPAFVMPNDPAVDHVLKAASEVLRRAGKKDGIDGYVGGTRTRVWEIASAIWSAICGMRISYALPPASFESQGQKIRPPAAIVDGRVSTCLDTALLFAAALEQAGLNPVIVLVRGHAFTGVWLQPLEFATILTDEAAALRRRIDVKDLLVFETTLATSANPASLGQAEKAALRHLAEDAPTPFEVAIDIRRARMQKIRPLASTGAAPAGAPDAVAQRNDALEEAPELPGFDVAASEVVDTPKDRLALWQRKLLNLTTSNRLLNLPEGGKVVRLVCPSPGRLEDRLAAGRKVKILPMPDLASGGRDEKIFDARMNENLREEIARDALEKGEVLSLLEREKLDATVVELYRKARSDVEEGGANTLFLALGFLKWRKSPTDTRSYKAPLILLPVRLERKSALSGVVMTQHEDDPRFNLTLLELLRQDFELVIPGLDGTLPADDSGIDVDGVWATVRRAIRDMPGFEVTEEVVLGTFSFAKYLMWKDLVDRADLLKESRAVRHLLERTTPEYAHSGEIARPEELDVHVDPAELFAPLPADSSQLAAVIASAKGHDFVLDGPPGTGKSQTIANMIAHNLALGRRVLFVAEKMAALNVVQRRLAEKGLAPFCLELHSAKATKTEVLKQLDRAWTAREVMSSEEWRREAAQVRRSRDTLNDVVRALHARQSNGLTLHSAIGRVVRDWTPTMPRLAFSPGQRHSEQEYARFRDVARRLGLARAQVDGSPDAMSGLTQTDWSNGWQEAMVAAARSVRPSLDALVSAKREFLARAKLDLAMPDAAGVGRLLRLGEAVLAAHGLDLRFAFSPDATDVMATVPAALTALQDYRTAEKALSTKYAPEPSRRVDPAKLASEWEVANEKFWPLSFFARRSLRDELARAGGATGDVDPARDIPLLATMRDRLADLDKVAVLLAPVPGWAGLATDIDKLSRACEAAGMLRAAITDMAEDSDQLIEIRRAAQTLVVDANELLGNDGFFARDWRRLREALALYETAADQFRALSGGQQLFSFDALRALAEAIDTHERVLKPWTDWQREKVDATTAGLKPLVDALENGAVPPAGTTDVFETAYARWFASDLIDAEPVLRKFSSAVHADEIETFRRLDNRLSELSARYIRAKVCGAIPERQEGTKRAGYAVLSRELQKQRRHKPIRQLATEMGGAMTELAPCMLMSPLSIAQYLPPDQALFDLVIFDEASQIAPWDAIGAMARGKQVIIAGDPRQMPPTSFFTRAASADADDTEADMESILDECLAAGLPMHSLSWHYRSQHESLIAFSNHRYYDSMLVTFPAPVTRASAVEWRRVEGVYARGQSRTNAIEAKAIVDEVVRRLRDPAFNEQNRSLGIITLNAEQQRVIEDLLDKARGTYPEIEPHFAEERSEPVVVKNLETVQGDERDVIVLGVGFGPTEPGGRTMPMNFGPLTGQGGWRRLNVALTRARREMIVFTSFDPGMIDLNRTNARAVRDLKHFLEFAERGPRALAEAVHGSVGGFDSPFEEAVARELSRRGWQVVPQIGVSRFRIDLGIVHPDQPGDYLVGIECDGATYHSAATARDRDKVRAAILKGLGWQLLRIWSTDWWIDKAGAAERLHRAIEAVLHEAREKAAAVAKEPSEEPSVPPPAVEEPPRGFADAPQDAYETGPQSPAVPDRLVATQVVLAGDADLARAVRARSGQRPYRLADLAAFSMTLQPDAFYDDDYVPVLEALIAHIVVVEAPLHETTLVQRVARAHGFKRAGNLIQRRVMRFASRNHFVRGDDTDGRFVWPHRDAHSRFEGYRIPVDLDDVRPIEEIAPEEIARAAADCSGEDMALEVARLFGIRRLSATARSRIERVLARDATSAEAAG